ncbi:MAG: BtpA/SgcQ family protein [bacterium]|nr:BtpA/SgcQ family protein [bacterium]
MSKFIDSFRNNKDSVNGKIFLPVIHLNPRDGMGSAMDGVRVAADAGADGAFLIAHGGLDYRQVAEIQESVLNRFQRDTGVLFPIGVNWLDLMREPEKMIHEASRIGTVSMIWSDAPGNGEEILQARRDTMWDGFYMGAVGFKYQAHVSNEELPEVARRSSSFMDVLVTSGDGTGIAINPERTKIIREAVGLEKPIAVASGVSISNYGDIIPYVDCFLVATSILFKHDDHRLDAEKTQVLAEAIHGWTP